MASSLCDQNARVIVMSSRGHQLGGFALEDLDFVKRPYDKWLAYGQAKTANALFAVALDARGFDHGVRAFSVHPGSIFGPLARHLSREEIDTFGAIDENGTPVIDPDRDMKTPQQGAATTIWCATAPSWRELAAFIVRIAISHRWKAISALACDLCNQSRYRRGPVVRKRAAYRIFLLEQRLEQQARFSITRLGTSSGQLTYHPRRKVLLRPLQFGLPVCDRNQNLTIKIQGVKIQGNALSW